MHHENRDYYRTRADEERERAASANSESIAQIHLELAEKYDALAREAGPNRADWTGSQSAQPA
jgi:hypothetical protein